MRRLLPLLFASLFFQNSFSISTGNDRVTRVSPHFELTVDAYKSQVLEDAAAWLEHAYTLESAFFDFNTPEKTQVVFLDDEDFSNGYAYAANQWIVIYLPSLRFQLRGTESWLPDVSSHELAHILTLRKMGLVSKFAGIDAFISWRKKNGNLDGDAAWIPYDVPSWLAEGLAQYGSMHCGFDTLDTHREMVLREAWNSGNLLPLKAMETYSRDSRSSELIYNQGFHLVDYLYRKYGRDAMNRMMESWQSEGYSGSFQKAFGASPGEIYESWLKDLNKHFANSQARPEAVSAFEVPYKVEDAPVFDPATQTLYYLSSADDDFGATHLYARTPLKTRMIQRDVNAPLHLAPDGSLLYTATRIRMGSGARISDLYRYSPRGEKTERLTKGLRIMAAVATKSNDIYAIFRRSGRTHIARITGDWTFDETDAPPGTEFTDLTPGYDGTLYVSAVRGNNSDILRLDIASKTLRPVLASKFNERDPFFVRGRLYFSGDQDGSYAIYSLKGKSLYRHTAAGPSLFAPFTDGKTLHYSAYTPHGFLLRSQPLDSGESRALESNSNAPYPAPAPVLLSDPEPDLTGMEFAGYSAVVGYAYTFHDDVFDSVINAVTRYNPCARQAYAGGAGYWADPEARNILQTSAILGQCAENHYSLPYVPEATLQYVNRSFTPDLFVQAQYQSLQINLPQIHPEPNGLVSYFSGIAGAVFYVNDYLYDIPEIGFLFIRTDWNSGNLEPRNTPGILAVNTFGFSVADRGPDFINQGVLGSATVGIGGSLLLQTNLEAHTNFSRALFVEADARAVELVGVGDDANLLGGTLAANFRIPQEWTLGSVGYRGLFLESTFLHAGISGNLTHNLTGLSLTRSAALIPKGITPDRNAASPSFVYNPLLPTSHMLELGLRLKMITPSARLAWWNFGWQSPVDDIRDGLFSVSISL